jgi:hypothetical protein
MADGLEDATAVLLRSLTYGLLGGALASRVLLRPSAGRHLLTGFAAGACVGASARDINDYLRLSHPQHASAPPLSRQQPQQLSSQAEAEE